MLNINGLDKFREFFSEYDNNYVLIGGTACSIIFDEIGENFRATKDLDIVLIIENKSEGFFKQLWEFIKEAGYKIESSRDKRCFYRFTKPINNNYPKMIELFSRNSDLKIEYTGHILPIHISDEISSLSAILLNDDYYNFMIEGRRIIDGISVLDEKHLIPFKVKAWCELIDRRKDGEEGQLKHIKKHFRDINNLTLLLSADEKLELNGSVKKDMERFINEILISEFVSPDIDKLQLHNILSEIYI